MKRLNTKKVAIALAMTGLAALLTGCGPAVPVQGMMPPAAVNPYGAGVGCAANGVNAVGFTATGAMIASNTLAAGSIPLKDNMPELYKPALGLGGRVFGSVVVNGSAVAPAAQISGQGIDGTLSANYTVGAQGTTLTGSISISPQKLSTLIPLAYGSYGGSAYSGMPMPQVGQQQFCLSSLAISLTLSNMGTSYGYQYGNNAYQYSVHWGRIYLLPAAISPQVQAMYPSMMTNPTMYNDIQYLQF